jgi:hypothetical protein
MGRRLLKRKSKTEMLMRSLKEVGILPERELDNRYIEVNFSKVPKVEGIVLRSELDDSANVTRFAKLP